MPTVDYNLDPLGSALAFNVNGDGCYNQDNANSVFRPVANDWACAMWIKRLATGGDYQVYVSQGAGVDVNNKSWHLGSHNASNSVLVFQCSSNGSHSTDQWTTFQLGIGTWKFVVFGRQSGSMFVEVNRSARQTMAFAGSFYNHGGRPFRVGCYSNNAEWRVYRAKAAYTQLYFWVSGLSGMPSSTDLDAMYNSGAGLTRRGFIAGGYTIPSAAFEFQEPVASAACYDWVGGQVIPSSGTLANEISHINSIDFTSLAAFNAYAVANKPTSTQWNANCYSGTSLNETGTYQFTGVPADADGPVVIQPASGHGHGGDFAQGAYFGDAFYLRNQPYGQVIGLRSETLLSIAAIDANSVSNSLKQCLANTLWVLANDGAVSDAEVVNNLVVPDASGVGILFELQGDDSATSMSGKGANNTIVGNETNTVGIQLEANEGAQSESLTLDLFNNIAVANQFDIQQVGTFDTLTLDAQSNVTSDLSGEITGEALEDIFVDPDNDDYNTLVDGATYRSAYDDGLSVDILGNARHSTYDIGAYEAVAPASLVSDPTGPSDLGSVVRGGAALTLSLNITNPGDTDDVTTVSVSVPAGYAITQDLPATIEAGATETLIVSLGTDTAGTFAGDISITSSVDQVDVAITGLVTEPVSGGAKIALMHGM